MNEKEVKGLPVLIDLIKKVKSGECVLFLGAGVHYPPPEDSPYSYPPEERLSLGAELSEKLADEFEFKKQFCNESCKDLQRVSLYIDTANGLGRKSLVDALDRYLGTGKKPSPALKMLASMPFKIYITTNYDLLLEYALHKHDKAPTTFVYNPNEREITPEITEEPTENRPILFKMHGDLDHKESIVITDEDYITFVQRMSDKDDYHPMPQALRVKMKMWPTLFVGYSLRDYNLRLLFRTLRWHIDKAKYPMSFAVDINPDPLILQVWQNERKYITFVAQDIWSFVPWLYKEIYGKEYTE